MRRLPKRIAPVRSMESASTWHLTPFGVQSLVHLWITFAVEHRVCDGGTGNVLGHLWHGSLLTTVHHVLLLNDLVPLVPDEVIPVMSPLVESIVPEITKVLVDICTPIPCLVVVLHISHADRLKLLGLQTQHCHGLQSPWAVYFACQVGALILII